MSSRNKSYHLRSDCEGECELPENPEPQRRHSAPSARPRAKSTTRPVRAHSHSLGSRRNGPKGGQKVVRKKVVAKRKVIGKRKKAVRSYRSKSRSTRKGVLRRRSTHRKAAPRSQSQPNRSSRSVSFASPSPRSSRSVTPSRSASPAYDPPQNVPKNRKKKVVRNLKNRSRSTRRVNRSTRRKVVSRSNSQSKRSVSSSRSSGSRTASSSRSDSLRHSQDSASSSHRSYSSDRSTASSSTHESFSADRQEDLIDILDDLHDYTMQALEEETSFLSISKTKSHRPVSSSRAYSPMSMNNSTSSSSSSSDSDSYHLRHLDELNQILEELQDSDQDPSLDVGGLDLTPGFHEPLVKELEPMTNNSDQGVATIIIDSELKAKSTCTLSLEEKKGERLLVVEEQIIICPKKLMNDAQMQPHTMQMKNKKKSVEYHFYSNKHVVDHCSWSLQHSDHVLFYRRQSKLSLAGGESSNHTVCPANAIAPVSFGTDSGRLFVEDLYYSRRLANSFIRSGLTVISFEQESRSKDQTEAQRQSMWMPEETVGHTGPVHLQETVELVGKELTLKTGWELKEELWQKPLNWTQRSVKDYELWPNFLRK